VGERKKIKFIGFVWRKITAGNLGAELIGFIVKKDPGKRYPGHATE